MAAFWIALAAKMAASALLVVLASLVVERAGPFVGAMVATLPISAGPAYVYLALDHGPDFVAASALTSLAVNAATALFIAAYAGLAARGTPPAATLGGALAAWLAGLGAGLGGGPPGLPLALALNAVAYAAAMILTRRLREAGPVARAPRRAWDVPLRAGIVMALVLVVVLAGRWLGPRAAGVAALVPAVLISLGLILHPRLGGSASAAVFAHTLPGMVGFGAAILVLHLAAVPLGSGPALGLALATCCAWNLGLVLAARLRAGSRAPQPPRTNSAAA